MAAGRLKFSRHAFPYGWSLLWRFDMETSAKATPPSRVLTRYQADEEPRLAGNGAAQAHKATDPRCAWN